MTGTGWFLVNRFLFCVQKYVWETAGYQNIRKMLPRASSTGGRSCRVAGVKKDTFERI